MALTNFARAQNTPQAAANLLSSNTSEFPQNSTVVLVHGAWADGSCWRNVILPLQQRGLHVICAPIPMTSLTNDATALNWAWNGPTARWSLWDTPILALWLPRCGKTESNLWSISRRSPRMRARQLQKCFIATHRIRKRPSWFPIPMALYGCRTMGFAERLPTRPLPIKQMLRLPCNGQSRFSAFKRPPQPRLENEALVVFTRRRGPHDQSEDSAIHGRAHGRARAIAQHRSQSDVHGAKSRDRRDPGGSTSNTLAIGPTQTNQIFG
jgi:hypothetical protein